MSMSLKRKVKELDARVTALEEGNDAPVETPAEDDQTGDG
jgi:hypothetical protein